MLVSCDNVAQFKRAMLVCCDNVAQFNVSLAVADSMGNSKFFFF